MPLASQIETSMAKSFLHIKYKNTEQSVHQNHRNNVVNFQKNNYFVRYTNTNRLAISGRAESELGRNTLE